MKLKLGIKMAVTKIIGRMLPSVWSHDKFVYYRLIKNSWADQIFNFHIDDKAETWAIDTHGKS